MPPTTISAPCVPVRHVGLIMDGNGRWARARGLPRLEGHRRGVEALRGVYRAGAAAGLTHMTIYAFSSENWRRPPTEVRGLMDLFRIYLRREIKSLISDDIRVRFIGDRSVIDSDLQALMDDAEERTARCASLNLYVAINYGGRAEIVFAARRLAARVLAGELRPADIDEDALGAELTTCGAPDPDLLIRTGGEERVSNFLLWQIAYAELMFVDKFWPDFTGDDLRSALEAFAARNRRFGALSA